MSQTYRLTYTAQSWRDTLLSLSSRLPDHVHPDNLQVLQLLPVFAVVVVIDRPLLSAYPDTDVNALMQAWADSDGGWVIRPVSPQAQGVEFTAKKEASPVSDVAVFRYALIPKEKHQITPEKRDAAAHIVDDQISAYLRRKLKPVQNHQYAVDKSGQVSGFKLGASKKIHHIDCHILSITKMLKRHKLACFDMDSTLIKQEVITELAKIAGVGEKVNEITEAAMRGEMDFNASFAARLKLLAGLDASVIDKVKPLLIPQAGAFATIAALKAMGYRTALISGGFTPFAEYIATLLGIDEYHANTLEIEGGRLTGLPVAPIIDGKQKAAIVAKIADRMSIGLDETICIGDGANDLPMMAISDLGVAYHAKPIVQVKADAAVNVTGLDGVLYALGYPELEPKNDL
ncbi:MAG: phosphoserine phosphatase SerB [Moraxella sp.]|nr:phosphoserine phosphatase SerB [Moraxella sp.]